VADTPVRVAVVGAGAMGQNHVRVLQGLPGARLVAVADSEAARRDLPEIPGYAAYIRMLDEEQPDAAIISAPTRLHHDVALACIERGIAVLVEKPLAATVAEGERVADAAAAADVPLAVGHIERFNPAVRELKRRLDVGELGRIYRVAVQRVGPFYQRQRDVGVTYDLATHDIDVVRMLLGRETIRVQAETLTGVRTPYDDALTGLVTFDGDITASLDVNWLAPEKVRTLALLGERGQFQLDYIRRTLVFCPSVADGEGLPQEIAVPDAAAEPLREELAAFIHAARREKAPAVSAVDGLAAMRVADALLESAGTGRPVRVEAGRSA
jgi:predicted dehydrogenase